MTRKAKRGPGGHFLPGQSGNPQGRTAERAISEWARQAVDKKELVAAFVDVMRGQALHRYLDPATGKTHVAATLPEGVTVVDSQYPSVSDRLRAAEYLWDKIEPPTKTVDLNLGQQAPRDPDFSKMTPSQLDRYVELTSELVQLAEPDVIDVAGEDDGNKGGG